MREPDARGGCPTNGIPEVQDCWGRVALRVSDAFTVRFEPPAKEKVSLRLALSSEGGVRTVEVRSASSPGAEEKALDAVEETAPFPRRPLRYFRCFSSPSPILLYVELEIQLPPAGRLPRLHLRCGAPGRPSGAEPRAHGGPRGRNRGLSRQGWEGWRAAGCRGAKRAFSGGICERRTSNSSGCAAARSA